MKDEQVPNNTNKCKIKINLNSEIDLYKIPIKTLKNSKLSDFNGLLIYQLLTEMISDSENINNNICSPKTESRNIIVNTNSSYSKNNNYNQRNDIYSTNNEDNYNLSYSNNGIYKYINDIRELKIEKINFEIKYDTKMGEDIAVIGSRNNLGNWEVNRALKMAWNNGNIWKGVLYIGDANIVDFEYKFILTCGNYILRWEDGYNRKFNFSKIKELIKAYSGNYTSVYLQNIEGINIKYDCDKNSLTMFCFWNIK